MRPISAGSILAKRRPSALASAVPQPLANQWAGRKKASAVHAMSKWPLEVSQSDAGAELGLARAYDSVDHDMGEAVSWSCKTPDALVYMVLASWTGPRTMGAGGF